MLTHTQVFRFSALFLLLLGTVGCGKSTPSQANSPMQVPAALNLSFSITSIRDLQSAKPEEAMVYLKGKTGNQIPFLGERVYELQDKTGSVWVLTRQAAPNQGDEVVIKGKVRQQRMLLDGKEQQAIYVEQQEQLEHRPSNQVRL